MKFISNSQMFRGQVIKIKLVSVNVGQCFNGKSLLTSVSKEGGTFGSLDFSF